MNGPRVRRNRLDHWLTRAGLTPTAARRELGFGPSFHAMCNGTRPPSERFLRDVPLLLASRTGIDVESIRDDIFSGGSINHRGGSFLAARLRSLDTKETAHA